MAELLQRRGGCANHGKKPIEGMIPGSFMQLEFMPFGGNPTNPFRHISITINKIHFQLLGGIQFLTIGIYI